MNSLFALMGAMAMFWLTVYLVDLNYAWLATIIAIGAVAMLISALVELGNAADTVSGAARDILKRRRR